MKHILIVLSLLLKSIFVCAAESIAQVIVLPATNDTIKLEVTSYFSYGSGNSCPEVVGTGINSNGDVYELNLYYDVTGPWHAAYCYQVDTFNLGVLPSNINEVRVHLYKVFNFPPQIDTTYVPPYYFVFLPVSVQGLNDTSDQVHITPNPNNGHFVLQGELDGLSRLGIVDVTGRVVYTDNVRVPVGDLNKEININGALPGLYMLRLYTDKGLLVRKLVVQ